MTIGLVGRKVGMTRIFTDDGDTLPVTVLDVSDNRITQIKTAGEGRLRRRPGRVRQAPRQPRAASRSPAISPRPRWKPVACCKEFRAKAEELANLKVGGKIGVDIFKVGPEGRRAGRDHRQGLRRRHQAPPLLGQNARRTAIRSRTASRARPARTRARRTCSPASACRAISATKRRTISNLRDRAHRRRAPAAAGQGLGARLERPRRRRAPGGEGLRGAPWN